LDAALVSESIFLIREIHFFCILQLFDENCCLIVYDRLLFLVQITHKNFLIFFSFMTISLLTFSLKYI